VQDKNFEVQVRDATPRDGDIHNQKMTIEWHYPSRLSDEPPQLMLSIDVKEEQTALGKMPRHTAEYSSPIRKTQDVIDGIEHTDDDVKLLAKLKRHHIGLDKGRPG